MLKTVPFVLFLGLCVVGCKEKQENTEIMLIEEQITFNAKNHALDNNDNFSPDEKYLCYDTRWMVFNSNLANSKSIEKVEIATGKETVLWKPESVSGENAAPGVAAVSYHPIENKVIFIHGPMLSEVPVRGYYGIRNRTGVLLSADSKGELEKLDMRDVSLNTPTVLGAQRGGTHRHEFSRDGKRIGFTYDDFLQQDYGRTIGYMESNQDTAEGYAYFFSLLLKPIKSGKSKPGEIEKAYGDSWVDFKGSKRAFIGKVRAENGIDYTNSLFVAEIPETTDISTADSGDKEHYPSPAKGIKIKRLTYTTQDGGIVRGSFDGKHIAYLSEDKKGVKQVFVIPTDGSEKDSRIEKQPKQITNYLSDASNIRWHPSGNSVFSISEGRIYVTSVDNTLGMGKTILLTPKDKVRHSLVVSPSGKMLAYNVSCVNKEASRILDGKPTNEYNQIFVLNIDKQLKP